MLWSSLRAHVSSCDSMAVSGADPLLCLLYEIDTPQARLPPNELQNIPSVWRYRTHITMEHLRTEFDSKIGTGKKGKSEYAVLKLFLQEVIRHVTQKV